MNAKEIYALPSESETQDLNCLKGCYYNHVPELGDDWWVENGNNKVVIKTIKEFYFDYRRFWALRTVWFDEVPVMVIQNAGREGDDHDARYITNENAYREMIVYIKTLIPVEQIEELPDLLGENIDLSSLTNFYGNELNGYFERH